MTTVHERRRNELQDALDITEERLAVLALKLYAMPTETEAQLRRVAEVTGEMDILLARSQDLTDKLNALSDTE